MANTLELKGYCTTEELLARYRGCEDVAVKPHWQMLWLKSKKLRTGETAEATGFKTDWVRRIIRRYNEGGPDAIRDYCNHDPATACGTAPGWTYVPYTYPHPLAAAP